MWGDANDGSATFIALLRAGKTVEAAGKAISTDYPLHHFAFLGNVDACACILEAGYSVNSLSGGPKYTSAHTALYCACENKRPLCAKLLLERKADPESRGDGHGDTPLMLSCEQGCFECVEFLLRFGADPNAVIPGRLSPLVIATTRQHTRIIQLLIAGPGLRADPDTVCTMSTLSGYTCECCSKGTALWLACHRDLPHAACELLKGGASIDFAGNAYGKTALFEACKQKSTACAILLIDARANVHIGECVITESKHSKHLCWTPLIECAYNGSLFVAQALLEASADVNAKAADGGSPMLHACNSGHLLLTKLLSCYDAARSSTIVKVIGRRSASKPTSTETAEDVAIGKSHKALALWLQQSSGWTVAEHKQRFGPLPERSVSLADFAYGLHERLEELEAEEEAWASRAAEVALMADEEAEEAKAASGKSKKKKKGRKTSPPTPPNGKENTSSLNEDVGLAASIAALAVSEEPLASEPAGAEQAVDSDPASAAEPAAELEPDASEPEAAPSFEHPTPLNLPSAGSPQCSVCFDAPISHLFIPCGHVCCCLSCVAGIMDSPTKLCPICRAEVFTTFAVDRMRYTGVA